MNSFSISRLVLAQGCSVLAPGMLLSGLYCVISACACTILPFHVPTRHPAYRVPVPFERAGMYFIHSSSAVQAVNRSLEQHVTISSRCANCCCCSPLAKPAADQSASNKARGDLNAMQQLGVLRACSTSGRVELPCCPAAPSTHVQFWHTALISSRPSPQQHRAPPRSPVTAAAVAKGGSSKDRPRGLTSGHHACLPPCPAHLLLWARLSMPPCMAPAAMGPVFQCLTPACPASIASFTACTRLSCCCRQARGLGGGC